MPRYIVEGWNREPESLRVADKRVISEYDTLNAALLRAGREMGRVEVTYPPDVDFQWEEEGAAGLEYKAISKILYMPGSVPERGRYTFLIRKSPDEETLGKVLQFPQYQQQVAA